MKNQRWFKARSFETGEGVFLVGIFDEISYRIFPGCILPIPYEEFEVIDMADTNEYGDPISWKCEQEEHDKCQWPLCHCFCHDYDKKEPKNENAKGDGK